MKQRKKPEEWTEDDWKTLVAYFKKDKILAFNPGEREYELSVAPANLLYRFTRPHCVVLPESWTEVRDIVEYAYENKLRRHLTVRCGGHSYTGFSTVHKGILVDLKKMTEVTFEYDDQKRPVVAVIQAGARWGDVYRKLIQDSYTGLIVNGGRCPSVGVSGFLLGGGLGPFTRSFGMGSDTLIGATIITLKDGKVVKLNVDADNDPDLFWALRGGGCATFGIVTEFRMKIQHLKGDHVTAARYVWYPNQRWKLIHPEDKKDEAERKAEEKRKKEEKEEQEIALLTTMTAFYTAEWPDSMTIDSNWMMDVAGNKGELGIRFSVYYDGDEQECDRIIKDNITDGVLAKEMTKRTLPELSTRFLHESLVLMWAEESRFSLPTAGENEYEKYCSFCFENDPAKILEITAIVKLEQDRFEQKLQGDKASLWVTFIHSGGQASRPAPDSTAFPWRKCTYQTYVTVKWKDKWLEFRATKALIRLKVLLEQYSLTDESMKDTNLTASFMNFSDSTLVEKGTHEIAYYGANRARLHKLKKERDPEGFFRWPWDKDVQEKVEVPVVINTAGEIDRVALAKASNLMTDTTATTDWNTFTPPPAYGDIYGTPYVDVN